MTKPGFTAVALVLDESGSMNGLRSDTIGGINTFLAEQKKTPGEVVLTLNKFADEVRSLHDFKPLQTIPDLTDRDYRPHGSTALIDAIGQTIDSLGARLAALSEDQRPSTVIVGIYTDGYENASSKYTRAQVAEKIRIQKDTYSWQFIFVAANQDAFLTASSLSIDASNTLGVHTTPAGVKASYDAMSDNITKGRSLGSKGMCFASEDYSKYTRSAGVAPQAAPAPQTGFAGPTGYVAPQVAPACTTAPVATAAPASKTQPHWTLQKRDNRGKFVR